MVWEDGGSNPASYPMYLAGRSGCCGLAPDFLRCYDMRAVQACTTADIIRNGIKLMANVRSQSQDAEGIAAPWARSSEEILDQYDVIREDGLDKRKIRLLLKKYGPNRLREAEKKSIARMLLNQVKSVIVILLAVAAILSCAFQEWMDGLAIGGVIVINTAIGFFMELKAVRSMEALHKMEMVTARVRRSGQVKELPSKQLVPGDIVVLEAGDIVSDDMSDVVAGKLQADESVLTGESLPVEKKIEKVDASASLGDRTNML